MLSMSLVIVLLQEWTPPEKPDPSSILNEARMDTRAKKYETALSKFVWFHENALDINRSLVGVRLSFALSYWQELGKVYPPALEKLKAIRDATEQEFLESSDQPNNFRLFHDVSAINSRLGEITRTAKLFKQVLESDPKSAGTVFLMARDSLIAAKEYELCGKFLTPRKELERIKGNYERMKNLPVPPRAKESILRQTQQSLVKDSAILVAVLAMQQKPDEAKEYAVRCEAIADSPELKRKLKSVLLKSLDGKFPEN